MLLQALGDVGAARAENVGGVDAQELARDMRRCDLEEDFNVLRGVRVDVERGGDDAGKVGGELCQE